MGHETQGGSPRATWRDWVVLVKPGIMLALLISALTAMVVAKGAIPPLELVGAVALGGALASGSAATLNNLLERDRDRAMRRTRKRVRLGLPALCSGNAQKTRH